MMATQKGKEYPWGTLAGSQGQAKSYTERVRLKAMSILAGFVNSLYRLFIPSRSIWNLMNFYPHKNHEYVT